MWKTCYVPWNEQRVYPLKIDGNGSNDPASFWGKRHIFSGQVLVLRRIGFRCLSCRCWDVSKWAELDRKQFTFTCCLKFKCIDFFNGFLKWMCNLPIFLASSFLRAKSLLACQVTLSLPQWFYTLCAGLILLFCTVQHLDSQRVLDMESWSDQCWWDHRVIHTHRIHGNGIFTHIWLILDGKCNVGKYISPMDPMG